MALAVLALLPRPVAAATPVVPSTDPRSVAFLRLEISRQGTSGMLPGGCITLAGDHVCVPRVTVDGRRLSDLAVLQGDVGVASGSPTHMPLRAVRAIRAGIALAVFHDLLALAARHDHITVATAEARALANHELHLYLSSPPPPGTITSIPPGMTPRQYYLSPRTIKALREDMVVGRERDRILHRYPGLTSGRAFRAWLQSQLPHHTILIKGKRPTFSIVAAYPAG